MMIKLYLEKLYRYDRNGAQLGVCVPFKMGLVNDTCDMRVWDGKVSLPVQIKVTARYSDGSIKFCYVRFIGNLPGNKAKNFALTINKADEAEYLSCAEDILIDDIVKDTICLKNNDGVISVDTGKLTFTVRDYSESIFDELTFGEKSYYRDNFVGPVLKDGEGNNYDVCLDKWKISEAGDCVVILKCMGENLTGSGGCEGGKHIKFEVKITAYAGASYVDLSYRIINTSEAPLHVASLTFAVTEEKISVLSGKVFEGEGAGKLDSTGCGDIDVELKNQNGPVYTTMGIGSLSEIENLTPVKNVRTCAASSNYRTAFKIGRDGHTVCETVDAKDILAISNEHIADVLYGTFFADRTDDVSGLCAIVFQAQQNFPKAVKADNTGVYVYLVPEDFTKIVMQPGMSREQKFELYFHDKNESLVEIDNRSLIYQMPDRPVVAPKVYKEAMATSDVYSDITDRRLFESFETMLIGKADCHGTAYGMLNFGDSVDQGYTSQGRGGGSAVWSNNEYDFPHACALMYFRTGTRRFMDYAISHASHWMDVDVCHYSSDPLRIGGQIEHTKGHVVDGVLVPSHEWVEGLLDYYHLTGDERGLETAIGIGENVLRLLDTPKFQAVGEANARETGWALRTLVALYTETGDEKWKEKCGWIVGHFVEWRQEYGCFIAPYTDNTLIRTGFMISVAVGSLMRYYRIEPSDELKNLMVSAIDDIVDNCTLDCGLFYYKELPSLARLGNNTLLLESMATGYELTGNDKYLRTGIPTFRRTLLEPHKYVGGNKKIMDDAVMSGSDSTKNFAQSFYPLVYFYNSLLKAGIGYDEIL